MKPATMSEVSILKAIGTLQDVQATNPPSSKPWQEASKVLNQLFKEMAKRERQAAKEGKQ